VQKKQHMQKKRTKNQEKAAEIYQLTKEEILWRHNIIIDCKYSTHYTFGHKSRHKKSLCHRNYLTLQLIVEKTGKIE
jgi:nitrous oxidase accessory protein NosD